MNKKEVIEILAIISVSYPNSFKNLTKEDKQVLVKLWERQFMGYQYIVVQNAIDSIISIDKSGFMPSIGRIKEVAYKITNPNEISDNEAWNMVLKALEHDYSYENKYLLLPDKIKNAIGSESTFNTWKRIDILVLHSTIAKRFMCAYNDSSKKEQEQKAIPESVKKVIESNNKILVENK